MKIALQVSVPQSLVAVKFTVTLPPTQTSGAAPASSVNTVLQPPEELTLPTHAANAASTAACV